MKKIVAGIIFVVAAICAYAQHDVTQFLGIPVDGSKQEMVQKLKAKGFRENNNNQYVLSGEFNGSDVYVYIITNNNKVSRIVVDDANYTDERSIQIRFNRLLNQFNNNPNYLPALTADNKPIPNDEDIRYESIVNKKRYEAQFYQKPDITETEMQEKIVLMLQEKYTAEELENNTSEELKIKASDLMLEYLMDRCSKKSVWFMISENGGKYGISIFYDNEFNRANGEDL